MKSRIAKMAVQVQLVLHIILLVLVFTQQASAQNASVAKPGCQDKCGILTISYPFGIGTNCSAADSRFLIYCDTTFNPPKALLFSDKLEVLNISLQESTIRVNNPVLTDCTNETKVQKVIDLSSPYTFSQAKNRFTAIGCNYLALIDQNGSNLGGCMSFCSATRSREDKICIGINCCQTRMPPFLRNFSTSLSSIDNKKGQGCRYAFIAEWDWFLNLDDIYIVEAEHMDQVPAVLDWKIDGECSGGTSYLCGKNSNCTTNQNSTNQTSCYCKPGYAGNPYLPDGCQDIDECTKPDTCDQQQKCINTPGSYVCSANSKKLLIVFAIATCGGLGVLLVLAATWWLYKVMKQRKLRKIKEKNFERNGGLLLSQQVSSSEGNVDTTKLFTSKELEMATDHYNKDRILGQGGQGTVYKGMLTDGKIVAVKKSKIEDESKQEQFINEVVLLSKINHRNIVKLHGCCLETDIPLLVYELVPNGTLFEYIHDHNEDFPLTWDIRVRVAIEIAGALFYLHSAASIPIYHRDIKSSNILLDEKYRAKIADFGTSKSIAIDQTHLTTRVQGTFGYLDPEYFQSSQFTDKSDVYSFGVVLVELLTGLKPILAPRTHDEGRSLATHFIMTMKENRIFDILDPRIAKEGRKEEITAFSNIAYRCLNLNGRKRPTMKQVAAELEGINLSNRLPNAEQHYEEIDYPVNQLNGYWDLTSTSLSSSTSNSVKVDIEPLIRKY